MGYTVRHWINDLARQGRLFFTRDELEGSLSHLSEVSLKMGLMRARQASLISRAWKGFYLILPPTYSKQGTLPITLYLDELMRHLDRPYCVALLNAAAFYGAAHQSPQSFFVMTKLPIPRVILQENTRIEFVGKREFSQGIPSELVKNFNTLTGYIRVTCPEFTALTLIQYSKRVGGLSRVVTVLEELIEECDFSGMKKSILNYVTLTCFQRLGYIVEVLLDDKERGENLYEFLGTNCLMFQKTLLSIESCKKLGNLNKRWNIIVNATVESDFL